MIYTIHTKAADTIPEADRAIIYNPALADWICRRAPGQFVRVGEINDRGALRHILLVPAAAWQRIEADVLGIEAEWRHDHGGGAP